VSEADAVIEREGVREELTEATVMLGGNDTDTDGEID
jgi:hypothetical protein